MLRFAYRQLCLEKGRSALTCVGIAAVFAVILVLQGFQQGLYAQLRDVALDRNVDLIATQAGVRNMVAARSVIPQMARGRVEAVRGVKVAHPMTALSMIYERDGRKEAVFLTVVDAAHGPARAGGPREVISGRLRLGDGEVLIDRSLAQLYDLAPGDPFVLAGYSFEIAGVTETTAAMFTPFVFISFSSLIDFYFETKLADDISAFPLLSYLLIEIQPDAAPSAVMRRIEEAVPDVDVLTSDVIARNDERLGETMFGAVLRVLIAVAYAAGALVVALFMFSTAEGRRKDLGILKALGFENRALVASIVLETAMLTVLAIPLGIAVSHAIAAGIRFAMPIYLVLPTVPGPLIQSTLACVGFALVGALAPLRFVRRLEPAEVFQS